MTRQYAWYTICILYILIDLVVEGLAYLTWALMITGSNPRELLLSCELNAYCG